ncbi:hypothetical protein L9F63_022830, partial [Diploptera punctata]
NKYIGKKFRYSKEMKRLGIYQINCKYNIYRTRIKEGSSVMNKFPEDVLTAENLTGGDPDILRNEEFEPEEKPDYRNIFGGENKKGIIPEKKTKSISPKVTWKVRPLGSPANGRRSQSLSPALNVLQQPRQITHPRFISEIKDDSDHVVRIRQQPSSTPNRNEQGGTPTPQYKCHQCDFTSNRLNVIVLHNKFHMADAANNGRGTSNKGGSTIKSKSAESKVGGKGKGRASTSSPNERIRARSRTVPGTNETPTRAENTTEKIAPKRKLADNSENTKTKEENSSNLKTQSPKTPEKQLKSSEKKSPIFGKRKSPKGSSERPAKKKKNDDQIRQKILDDWVEVDEEQEEKEIELIKQELSKSELCSSPTTNPTSSTPSTMTSSQNESIPEIKEEIVKPKITSCFDFDDSEDANLGIELEERAKKFVENRKIPRILEDKSEPVSKRRNIADDIKPITLMETSNMKVETEQTMAETSKETDSEKIDETVAAAPDSEDLDVAFKTLLDETAVPSLPEVPELPIAKVASPPPDIGSSSLPDVVLDSNNSETTSSTSCLPEVTSVENAGGGDHDYSIKSEMEIVEELPKKAEVEENLNPPKEECVEVPARASIDNDQEPIDNDDDEMELDINSMPVVMTDAIIKDEPGTKPPTVSMPLADLIPKTESSQSVVSDESKSDVATASSSVKTAACIGSSPTLPETVITVPKSTVVVNTQVASSSGSSVVKAPIKTVKLQAAASTTAATLSSIGKLKGAGGPTVLSQKGPGGGKFVIVQAQPSQQSRYTVGKSAQQRVTVKAAQQQLVQQGVGGGKVVILTKPQGSGQQKILTTALTPQQRIITTSGKLQTQTQPQRIISSTGAILTQINPRSVVAKGTKLTPITQQQMRALQGGKQTLGKFTMQSTQAKVILPSMQNTTVSQTSPVRVIGTLKPQTNTILIQTTQGTTVSGTVVAKSVASTSAQIQPKITTTPGIARLSNSKPKILASSGVVPTVQRITIPTTMVGKTIQTSQVQQKVVGIRTAVSPRMVVQKIQSPATAKAAGVGLLTNVSQLKKVTGVAPKVQQKVTQAGNPTPTLHKISPSQSLQKVIVPQQLKKAITQQKVTDMSVQGSKHIPVVVAATNVQSSANVTTTQPLPNLQPNITIAPAVQSSNLPLSSSHSNVTTTIPSSLPSLQPASTTTPVIMSEQIAQVVAATPSEQLGDGSTATYVLVTIDDSGALQPYDNSTLLSYDGSAQNTEGAARTLYIDPSISSSGDLENIILTIDNSASNSGTVLNLGQTNALPISATTNIAVENSNSMFNIGPSNAPAPQSSGTNQDILAEALANTQVFQPDNTVQDSLTVVNSSQSTVMTPRLLESSILTSTPSTLHQTTMLLPSLSTVLPPPNPAGVLETSLTLNQPIMTPLEVPSAAVPTLQAAPPPVPSSLELPLTITQPSLSVTSQSFPSLSVTTQSQSSPPNSSISLTSPVSAGSFNPSMPLLSEETDSQSEININISEQQSVMPPISVSSGHIEKQDDVTFNETIDNIGQETTISRDETLLTSAKSESLLSYENIPETAASEKEAISQKSSELESPLEQSSPSNYQSSDLINAESQVQEPSLSTSDHQTSLLVENNKIDNSVENHPNSTTNEMQIEMNDKCYSDNHSTSDHVDPERNSINDTDLNNVENHPQESTSSPQPPFIKSSDISELAIQQKSDINQPSYDSSTDDSQLQLNNETAVEQEASGTDNYLPAVSESTSSVEDAVAASNSSDQSIVSRVESSNLSPYSGVSSNLPGNNEADQSITNVSSQSMPLLVDEPNTETDSLQPAREKSPFKEPQFSLNNDVEMSLEQTERSKDQGSLSPLPVPCQVMHDVERSDSDDDFPPAFSPPSFSSPSKKMYSKNDVVWVRCNKEYWPAVVTNVDKKAKKAYIKTVNSPRKAKGFKVGFKSLISFDNKEKNQELLILYELVLCILNKNYDEKEIFYISSHKTPHFHRIGFKGHCPYPQPKTTVL